MNFRIDQLRQSNFIRNNTVFFVGTLLIGVLNYLYYPVLGRMLQPVAFGEVQTLISLFLQITTFLSVLGLLAINIIANHSDARQRNRVILELEKLALLISVVLLGLTIVGGSFLKTYFQFDSVWPFILLALAVVVTVPFTFRTAYLRGKEYFGLNSVAGIVGAAGKLFLSVLFVAIGFKTAGAIFGVVIAQILAFLYAGRFARKYGFTESLRGQLVRLPDLQLILPEIKYSGLVLATSLTITIFYSIDIVVVKHHFDVYTAGLYASVATVSRALFFLTASISQVLMPAVKLQRSERENMQVLLKSALLLTGIGGAALAVICIAPRFILRVLMGGTYLAQADLLPRLSVAMFIVSILNLLMTYHMALRRYAIGVIGLVGVVLTYLWMQFNHGQLSSVVNSLVYGSLLITLVMAVWTVVKFRGQMQQEEGGGA